jgi:hypothetical protein
MNISPFVRYFIIAEDYAADPENSQFISALHILSSIHSVDDPPFPALVEQICCIVGLTDGRGTGIAQVVCLEEETGLPLFGSLPHKVVLGPNPLEVAVAAFRILDCRFPRPGAYTLELYWNDEPLISYTLRVR